MNDDALLALLSALKAQGYVFVTPTPATHARVLKRLDKRQAKDLRDVFGWSLPFEPSLLEGGMLAALRQAGALEETPGGLKSRLRVSTLDGLFFLHSAYPTNDEDAVFLGPDSYRFAALIEHELAGGAELPPGLIVDIGAGAGVGGLTAARRLPVHPVVMTDVNRGALDLARVNARFAGIAAQTRVSDSLKDVDGDIALALANPPYIDDAGDRAYRDGGAMHGGETSVDMARMAARRLVPGGRLILYTGAAIVNGENPLLAALRRVLEAEGCVLTYRELDPDVFGEELDEPAYRDVERIAVVAAIATKRPA